MFFEKSKEVHGNIGPSTGTQNDAKQQHNTPTDPWRKQSEDETSRRSPWPGSAVCTNRHQEIFVHCESSRSMESPTRWTETTKVAKEKQEAPNRKQQYLSHREYNIYTQQRWKATKTTNGATERRRPTTTTPRSVRNPSTWRTGPIASSKTSKTILRHFY